MLHKHKMYLVSQGLEREGYRGKWKTSVLIERKAQQVVSSK